MLYEKLKTTTRRIRDCFSRNSVRDVHPTTSECDRPRPVIFKEVREFHQAYLNCLRTSPMAGELGGWTPRMQGNWWREEHRVYPQTDGTYGFLSEQEYFWFVLKWS